MVAVGEVFLCRARQGSFKTFGFGVSTLAPSSLNRMAGARPMPELPPVMMTDKFWILFMC